MPTAYICTTCGVQHAPSETPPSHCLICEDDRQYVNPKGQSWTTLAALQQGHEIDWREQEPNLHGIGATPRIAIGQRALFIAQANGGVMWDCIPLVNEDVVARLKTLGGVRALTISHPHFCASMVDWSEALGGVPIHLHEDCRDYVMRPHKNIHYWSGETLHLGEGITLIRCGGHFSGSAVLHWSAGASGNGALLTGDTITVVEDTRWMSFMRSFANLIPLNAADVRRIGNAVAAYRFERVYSAWWDRVCEEDGYHRLSLSAARYIQAIKG